MLIIFPFVRQFLDQRFVVFFILKLFFQQRSVQVLLLLQLLFDLLVLFFFLAGFVIIQKFVAKLLDVSLNELQNAFLFRRQFQRNHAYLQMLCNILKLNISGGTLLSMLWRVSAGH